MMDSCEDFINVLFDVFAVVVSISDLATDIIVTYNFYQQDRMIFFGLSLSFIILAQISYVFAFVFSIGNEDKPWRVFLLFICLLPLSPIISFIFYLTEDPNSWTSEFLMTYFPFTLDISSIHIDARKSKLRQWMKRKLRKHLGHVNPNYI